MKTIINGWDCTNLDQAVINLITKFNSNDELIDAIRKSEMDSKYNCYIFGGRQALIYMGTSGRLVAWIEGKRENGNICLDPMIHIKEDNMKKENRSIQDYQRMADNYDIQAFIDGRAIEPIDVYDYVVDNLDWLNEEDFLNETARLQSLGHPELDSFILAAMNFSKYPPITLAELDTYLEV